MERDAESIAWLSGIPWLGQVSRADADEYAHAIAAPEALPSSSGSLSLSGESHSRLARGAYSVTSRL